MTKLNPMLIDTDLFLQYIYCRFILMMQDGFIMHRFDNKMMLCSWDDGGSVTYMLIIVVLGVLIPSILVTFFYISLFM